MGARMLQRATVVVLVLAAVGGALVAHAVSANQLDHDRATRLALVRDRVAATLRQRAYYLEDVADMVGVHDDADVAEFTRYAHVRGEDADRDHSAVVAVQWLRRSPSGRLSPAGDVPRHTDIR